MDENENEKTYFGMKQQPAFNWLIPVITFLTAISAGAGLFREL